MHATTARGPVLHFDLALDQVGWMTGVCTWPWKVGYYKQIGDTKIIISSDVISLRVPVLYPAASFLLLDQLPCGRTNSLSTANPWYMNPAESQRQTQVRQQMPNTAYGWQLALAVETLPYLICWLISKYKVIWHPLSFMHKLAKSHVSYLISCIPSSARLVNCIPNSMQYWSSASSLACCARRIEEGGKCSCILPALTIFGIAWKQQSLSC